MAEHAEELKAPWSAMSGDAANAAADMRSLVRQVHVAAFGVLSAGTESQMAQARKVLAQTGGRCTGSSPRTKTQARPRPSAGLGSGAGPR